jgi:hypothetical protein
VTGQADEDRRLAMLLQAERLVELEAELKRERRRGELLHRVATVLRDLTAASASGYLESTNPSIDALLDEAETVLGQVVELEGDIRPHRPSYIRPPELGP